MDKLPPNNITFIINITFGGSFSRCAEPIRLKDRKLKQVDPELLCKESNPTDSTQEDQTDPTDSAEPIPFRSKPDATTTCHTYLFPQIRMDCSNRGKLTVHLNSPDPFSSLCSALNLSVLSEYTTFLTQKRGQEKYQDFMSVSSYACD